MDGPLRPSMAFCPLFIMRIPISLPCPTVSAVCEFFTNDETEGIKCILTERHTGSESNGYAPAESSLKNSLLKR